MPENVWGKLPSGEMLWAPGTRVRRAEGGPHGQISVGVGPGTALNLYNASNITNVCLFIMDKSSHFLLLLLHKIFQI